MSAYPAALTNKAWQKNKGLLAKAKPIGIGEALTATEKAFNSSGFALDPVQLGTETVDPMQFGQRYEKLGTTLQTQAKSIDAAAATVQQRITAAKTTFAGNKAVLAVLGRLESDLADFRAAVKPNGTIFTQQRAAVLAAYKKVLHANAAYRLMMGQDQWYTTTKNFYDQVLKDVKKLEADPRVDKIHELWGGNQPAPRSLRTTPRGWDQVIAKEFPATTAAIRAGKAWDTFNKNLPWIDEVGNEQGQTASKLVRAMIKGNVTEQRAVSKFALEYSQSLMTYRNFVNDLAKLEKLLKKFA